MQKPSCTSENVFVVLAAFFCGVFVALRWPAHFYFSWRAGDATGFGEIASLVHRKNRNRGRKGWQCLWWKYYTVDGMSLLLLFLLVCFLFISFIAEKNHYHWLVCNCELLILVLHERLSQTIGMNVAIMNASWKTFGHFRASSLVFGPMVTMHIFLMRAEHSAGRTGYFQGELCTQIPPSFDASLLFGLAGLYWKNFSG